MNDFFTQVDVAVRAAVQRLRTWFDPPIDGAAKPLEIREAIVEDVEQHVESVGGGRRVLPYNHVTVTVVAPDKPSRVRLQAALADVQEAVAARLGEIRCAVPSGLVIEPRYVTKAPAAWAPDRRLGFEYQVRDAAPAVTAAPEETPRLHVTIARGQATDVSYSFSESYVCIGRTPQAMDGRGRLRTNHVAFLEDGDDHSRTVGRAHASIRYDRARREFRVFDDGSHNGTRVMRNGALLEVKPHDPVGVTLRSGDELQVGTAALRVQIEAR